MKKLGLIIVFVTMISSVALSQMIFSSDYEDGQLLAPGASKETTTSYGMKVDTNITRAGDLACRFEARHGDPIYGGSARSEQKTGLIFDQTRGEVIWIGYSIYYPADMANTSQEEIIGQFTQTTTSGSWHPCIGFKNQGDFTLRPYVRQGSPRYSE